MTRRTKHHSTSNSSYRFGYGHTYDRSLGYGQGSGEGFPMGMSYGTGYIDNDETESGTTFNISEQGPFGKENFLWGHGWPQLDEDIAGEDQPVYDDEPDWLRPLVESKGRINGEVHTI